MISIKDCMQAISLERHDIYFVVILFFYISESKKKFYKSSKMKTIRTGCSFFFGEREGVAEKLNNYFIATGVG